MGKAAKGPKFYAVARGNGGPQIYEDWPACEKAVHGYPGAMHKSFKTMQEAQDYIRHNGATGTPISLNKPQNTLVKAPSAPLYPRPPNVPTGNFTAASFVDTKPTISSSPSLPPNVKQENSSTQDGYAPRLTTRYAPYPQAQSRPASQGSSKSQPTASASSIFTFGVPPPLRPSLPFPTQFKPNQASSSSPNMSLGSQDAPVEVSSDVEQDMPQKSYFVPDKSLDMDTTYPVASTSILPLITQSGVEMAPEPPLSLEQQKVLKKVLQGGSIFFTGSAGVGKSVLTRAIIKTLRHKYSGQPNAVGVTATTGIAATNIGGCTLHSWAGCGLAKLPVDKLMFSIIARKQNGSLPRWKECKALIVDEVSMLDGEFLDKLEQLGRSLRGSSKPFGGIQLILTGDFFQLPPVASIETGYRKTTPKFAFQSDAWASCIKDIYVLKQVHRQKDSSFVDLLNELRMGELSKLAIKQFQALHRKVQYDDGIEPTCLYPLKKMVVVENNRRLNALKADAMTFNAEDTSGRKKDTGAPYYTQTDSLQRFLDSNTLVEKAQTYKEGAQVMLVKNIQGGGGLVNGSIGKIVGFLTKEEVRPTVDPSHAAFQGMSEQDYLMYEAENGAPPPFPVLPPNPALAISNIEVAQEARKPIKDRAGRVLEEDEAPMEIPPGRWPVVEFKTGRRMLLPPMSFSVENAEGTVEASRSQVPLILAWALSIHKSQGQTLERVKVDLGDAFEAGMGYVALSRATKLETLQILRFNPSKIRAHKDVISWYDKLMQEEKDAQDQNDEW